jgi:hypothetical protein
MTIDWQQQQAESSTIFSAQSSSTDKQQIKHCVDACLQKMIEHLEQDVTDQAMYLVCQWLPANATLQLLTADPELQPCGKITVQCQLDGLKEMDDELLAEFKFWLRDYLTTAAGFLHYSLVAVMRATPDASPELL